MPQTQKVSDADLVHDIEAIGVAASARKYGMAVRSIYGRRERLEKKLKRQLVVPNHPSLCNDNRTRHGATHPMRQHFDVETGTVIVFGDCHYWPGPKSTAHRALVKFIHEDTPSLLVANGDVIDMAQVSRFAPIGWRKPPTVADEIEIAKDRLHEIVSACTKKTQKAWNLGNHDGRFESHLADKAKEYAKLHGFALQDHFPLWTPGWSSWINDDVVIKHRFKGGDNATWNNLLRGGKNIVTGHLHGAQVRPFTDYNGTRWGMDHGCLSEVFGDQFIDYTEDNPLNWRSGFGILTFNKGRLLQPELVLVWDAEHVQFRGKLIRV
jgi:hypothetical protein